MKYTESIAAIVAVLVIDVIILHATAHALLRHYQRDDRQ